VASELESVIDPSHLVMFERWKPGVGGGFGFVEECLGHGLELTPSLPVECGCVADLPEHAAPFDDDAVDIAIAEDVGDKAVFGPRIAVDGMDDAIGTIAVFGWHPVFEVAIDVLEGVGGVTSYGETSAPAVVIAAEAETGVEIGEVEEEFVDGIGRVFEGSGDGESVAALEEADDATASGGMTALIDEGEASPEEGGAGGGGEVATGFGEETAGAIGREDLAFRGVPEGDAMAVDGDADGLLGEGDEGDDVLGVDIEAEDGELLGVEVLFEDGSDGCVPGFDGGLATVPTGDAAGPFGEDDAVGAETFGDDEGATEDGSVRGIGDLGETAGADLFEGDGNGEGGFEMGWGGWSRRGGRRGFGGREGRIGSGG
jgi:hypothetical protein